MLKMGSTMDRIRICYVNLCKTEYFSLKSRISTNKNAHINNIYINTYMTGSFILHNYTYTNINTHIYIHKNKNQISFMINPFLFTQQ